MPVHQAAVQVHGLNALSAVDFQQAMSPFFEGAPAFLGQLASARPFRDDDELFERAGSIARAMPEADQLELIDAHPRIGASPGSVSAMSFAEQGYGLDASGARAWEAEAERSDLQVQLDALNTAYEDRFGFRFVVFVAGRSRAELVPVMEARLTGERESEKQTALNDVIAVARDRWRKRG